MVSVRLGATLFSVSDKVRMELDSHSDTLVVGRGCLIFHDHCRTVRVLSYDPEAGARECRTVSAAVAWDHPQTGQVYLLVVHHNIEVPNLPNHLLSPMQCCMNGVSVNDIPKFLAESPDDSR